MATILGSEKAVRRVRTPLQVSLAVWSALFLREAGARLFAGRAAWVWLLLEPVAHALFLMLLFATLRDRSVEGVAEYVPFLLVGIMGFQIFRHTASRCMLAVDAAKSLFVYRQVKPIDAVLVRGFLEGVLQVFIFVALIFAMVMWGYDEVIPHDMVVFVLAYVLLWLIGWGLGLVLSTGTLLAPEFPKLAGLIMMPLYFLSGVFYRPQRAPPDIREWLLLNPIVHGIESMRAAMFPGYHMVPEISLWYLAYFALILVFLGLTLQLRYALRLAEQ